MKLDRYDVLSSGTRYLAKDLLITGQPMNNRFDVLIVVLIPGWLAGYFVLPNLSDLIHLLILIAFIRIVNRTLMGRKIN